jgi:Tol biopolymer transport system component
MKFRRPLLVPSLASSLVGVVTLLALLPSADAHDGHGRFVTPDGGAGAPAPAPTPTDWDVNAAHGPGKDANFTVNEGTWLGLDVSPDGTKVLFDLLGDLYTVPVAGGPATRLTTSVSWETDAHWSPDGKRIVYTSDADGNENLWTMSPDGSAARAITKEQGDRWSDGVWAPPNTPASGKSGEWLVGRRRSTDTRSIGVQELWMLNTMGGAGTKLTTLDADPHAGEAAFDADGHTLWFSTRSSRFEYNHNPHQGLWELATIDLRTGERTNATQIPGGAIRPTPSPIAGGPLAFITRDRLNTVLMLRHADGHLESLVDDLDPDAMEAFELRSAYPRMDWSPDGTKLYYWAKGHINELDVKTRARRVVAFAADVKTRVTQAVRPVRRLSGDNEAVDARVVRWAANVPGMGVVSSAMGTLWSVPDSTGAALPLTPMGTRAFFPQGSPDGKWLTYVTWDDRAQGQVWVRGTAKGKPSRQITKTPADYQAPAISPDGQSILYLRGTSTQSGHELGEEPSMELVVAALDAKEPVDGTALLTIPFRGSGGPSARPQWSPDGSRIYWLEDVAPTGRTPETAALVSVNRLGTDKQTAMTFPKGAGELRLSPDFSMIAAKIGWDAVVAPMPPLLHGSLNPPSFADLPQRKLTNTGASWLDWSNDHTVTWTTGKDFYSLDVNQGAFFDGEHVTLADHDEAETPSADLLDRTVLHMHIPVVPFYGNHTFAFTHARILPMDGPPIADGTVVVQERRIIAVGANVAVPEGAEVIDLAGKTLLPGIIDVHAHLHYASGDIHPNQEWRHLVNLAYGVTTVFDPSAANDLVFGQGEEIASGRMAGPRVLSTGNILYGALDNQALHAEKYEDAEDAVQRQKLVGAWGVKSYQQSHRSHRQWIVEACRKLGLLNVPEGGGDLFQNLGMILDGHSSIEHAIPVSPIYDDIVQLWKRSDTTWVPTLLVVYGGPSGEVEPFANERVYDDARLSKWTPPWVLIGRAFRLPLVVTDPGEFRHHLTAIDAAKLGRQGVRVALGGHGQLQGLGPHWELEALGGPGAMTPDEALHAATINGASHLGLAQDLGSITVGKVADLFIVDGDPLQDLKAARNVVYVMRDGRLWDASTMQELPRNLPRKKMGWEE